MTTHLQRLRDQALDDGLLHATDDGVTTLCGAPLLERTGEEEDRLVDQGRACRICWHDPESDRQSRRSEAGRLLDRLLGRLLRGAR